jgi:hypothetical protein
LKRRFQIGKNEIPPAQVITIFFFEILVKSDKGNAALTGEFVCGLAGWPSSYQAESPTCQ